MESQTKVMVAMLVVALFVSLFGTLSALNKISGLETLTGLWGGPGLTTYGAVNLSIESKVLINFSDDTSNFGTGYICTAGCNKQLVTLNTEDLNDTSCNCGWLATAASGNDGLILENVGNRIVRVNLSNQATSSGWFGADGGYAMKWAPELPVTTCENSTSELNAYLTYTNITSAISAKELCEYFNTTAAEDEIYFDFQVAIPLTAPVGAKEDIWTAVATDNMPA